ncbi:phytanoyl-CoA dioxygenase family protein [Spirosoma sp. BT702]|uniref:Phytanoyl-CoA dioxygenase family protein n=1 Tax=Spirosoma profusum TaxID=2771354 RepID=A0A926XWC3_9BACT|nr:phytanoyl-CoA dioxygenase family protein [Spirosoma profusum]MBD2702004.1 phytanoyl-CoA dioxygenase family protein [Spirosoma profusum]
MEEILTKYQIDQFITKGFIRIDNAFPSQLAEAARNILWRDTGCDPNDSSTWIKPVVRLGMYVQEPFVQAANTPILHQVFDQLIGRGRWIPPMSMGTFPVRFPSDEDPGDAGWHVDASFPGADPDNYFDWRINVRSKGRALLMLFLFSDVSEQDAPTRIRVGSHLDVARLLAPAGEQGLSFMGLANKLEGLPERNVVTATGMAGTVYLCHPFLAHAAQAHQGKEPRFLAQPPLLLRNELTIEGAKDGYAPVEKAIRLALER